MKLFKNPNRGRNNHVKPQAYVPQYVELNKEPVVIPYAKEDFSHRNLPKQVKVSSGQNQEAGFVQASTQMVNPEAQKLAASIQEQIAILKQMEAGVDIQSPVVQRKFHVENNFYDEPLAAQSIKDFSTEQNEQIRDEDIEIPNFKSNQNIDNKSVDVDSDNQVNFSNVIIGEYVVLYDNDIIAAGNLDDISDFVENLCVSDEYNVDVNKLVVFKKMNLRTGILISD